MMRVFVRIGKDRHARDFVYLLGVVDDPEVFLLMKLLMQEMMDLHSSQTLLPLGAPNSIVTN